MSFVLYPPSSCPLIAPDESESVDFLPTLLTASVAVNNFLTYLIFFCVVDDVLDLMLDVRILSKC